MVGGIKQVYFHSNCLKLLEYFEYFIFHVENIGNVPDMCLHTAIFTDGDGEQK